MPEALVDAELAGPTKTFCCSRIDSPAARATCEIDAETRCGFATGGRSHVDTLEFHDGGDVAFGELSIVGPKGKGRCSAQFQRGGSTWYIVNARYIVAP